jgi:ADP-ribose pyrophosphatase YjhB (NUDIX family)
MNYCSECAAPVELRIPEGDTLPRHVCGSCHTIHYSNPKVVVGCIPEWEDKILLCQRAIEPRYGLWTLPAGFMENFETTMEGAARETLEEAKAAVDISELYTLINLPEINQVYVMFRGAMRTPEFAPGSESLDVQLCDEDNVPWDKIAFPVIDQTLRLYFRDRRRGQFGIYTGAITRPGGKWKDYRSQFLNGATK